VVRARFLPGTHEYGLLQWSLEEGGILDSMSEAARQATASKQPQSRDVESWGEHEEAEEDARCKEMRDAPRLVTRVVTRGRWRRTASPK